MKKNEGITLIALIITIIILVILTAITLNNVIGSDLIGLAGSAAGNYIDAEKEEEDEIRELMSKSDSIEKKLSGLVTEKSYGDYVDYPVDLGTTLLNGKSEGKNLEYDWKIFFKDSESGRIFIIADDYVPYGDLIKNAAETGAKMTRSSENKSKYCWSWKEIPDYQTISTSPDDIEELFWLRKWKVSDHQSLNNSKCVSTLLNTTNWEDFKNSKYADYAIGGPTVEMWCNSWNGAHVNSKIFTNVGESEENPGYYVGDNENTTEHAYIFNEIDRIEDQLWFPHYTSYNTFDGDNYCYGYWLASPSKSTQWYVMGIYSHTTSVSVLGCNQDDPYYFGLRPVVCLKSDISAIYDSENNVYHLK